MQHWSARYILVGLIWIVRKCSLNLLTNREKFCQKSFQPFNLCKVSSWESSKYSFQPQPLKSTEIGWKRGKIKKNLGERRCYSALMLFWCSTLCRDTMRCSNPVGRTRYLIEIICCLGYEVVFCFVWRYLIVVARTR